MPDILRHLKGPKRRRRIFLEISTHEGETTVLSWNEVHQGPSDSAPLVPKEQRPKICALLFVKHHSILRLITVFATSWILSMPRLNETIEINAISVCAQHWCINVYFLFKGYIYTTLGLFNMSLLSDCLCILIQWSAQLLQFQCNLYQDAKCYLILHVANSFT